MSNLEPPASPRKLRWWPVPVILGIYAVAMLVTRNSEGWEYEQRRTNYLLGISLGAILLLLVWWLGFSRARWKTRLLVLLAVGLPLSCFRLKGFSGDFLPIFEPRFRWTKAVPVATSTTPTLKRDATAADYPQFLGPHRDGRLDGPALQTDWTAHPPEILWRQAIGAAWSGFSVVGERALTLEQEGELECVTCYELTTGKLLWKQTNPGRYATAIAGEGPRTTPTIVGDRVFTFGATGVLRCLGLATGEPHWTRDVAKDAGVTEVPSWGFASSPLVHEGSVMVSAGGKEGRSLLAYRVEDGQPAWQAGSRPISYSSLFLVRLAERDQVLAFNSEAITAHDPTTGTVLWEHPWGKGMPHVAIPVVIGNNRVLFSSGYGVGSALLEIAPGADGKLTASEVWKTVRFQAKFSNPVEWGGYVYGLSDGIFACLDPKDGTVRWKDGRYGHGQGLLVKDLYLLMSEGGELVLLRPTPDAANELARFPVFDAKTWNPIALAGDLLLVRNDQEAACIRVAVKK